MAEADLFADDYLPVVDSVLGEAERGKKVIITTLSNAYMYIIIISTYTGCLRHSIHIDSQPLSSFKLNHP